MSLREQDPIRFQVIHSALRSIVDEMGALIQRTALSLVVSEGRDYCGTILTREGDLVTSGSTDLPAHLGTHPYTVKGAIEWLGVDPAEYFAPGDIVVMNDAYIGGTHNHDVRVIMPVFLDGELAAFTVNSSHWTDVGGHVPGTFDPNARSSHGEGLIIPPIKLVDAGVLNEELVRVVLRNIRVPEITYGDLLAQIGAVRLSEDRLHALAEREGSDVVVAAMRETIEYSEALLRARFQALPDGTWSASATIDRDPGSDDDDPLQIHLDMTIAGDRAIYDFTRSAPQARGAVNAPIACTVSAALVGTKCVFADVPMSQGVFNAIDFRFPEEPSVVNARYPAPISGMAAAVFPGVVNCVLTGYAGAIPERSMAEATGLTNITWGGTDTRAEEERDYVCYLWLEGGWGARGSGRDGATAMTLFATSATNQPIELHERGAPFRFDCYRLEPDSGGPGKARGGCGVTRRWTVTAGRAAVSCLGNGGRVGPQGVAGGRAAPPNRFVSEPGAAGERELGMFVTGYEVGEGGVLEYRQAGGGGWGDPFERDPLAVLEDVRQGYVTSEGARRDYGVAVETSTGELRLDAEGTAALRSAPGARLSSA